MPMSDFRRKKLIYVFKTYFDVDNSGAIDQHDFELAAERMCRIRNWDVNEGKGAETHQRFLKVWDVLKGADTDSDGSVDEDEWCAMWEDYANGKRADLEWQDLYRDFIFQIIDTSSEGTIEENEFIVVNTRGGVSRDDCVTAYNKLTKVRSSLSHADKITH